MKVYIVTFFLIFFKLIIFTGCDDNTSDTVPDNDNKEISSDTHLDEFLQDTDSSDNDSHEISDPDPDNDEEINSDPDVEVGPETVEPDAESDSTNNTEIPEGPAVYVHSSNGSDREGQGSQETPFRTVQYAIEHSTPPINVLVAAGTYTESIFIAEGLSLYGGFNNQDWNDRNGRAWNDPTYMTTLQSDAGIAVTSGIGITPDTILDGFNIIGGISIHDNHSHGIYLYDGSSPTIRGNQIHGGNGDEFGTGIGIFGSSAVICDNRIMGGAPENINNYAIRSGNQSDPLIASNDIIATASNDISYGILINGSSPKIMNNTINGGSGPNEAYGIFIFVQSSPVIENNIIFTTGGERRVGIFEFSFNTTPISLRNNDIFDCPTALYRDYESLPHDLTEADPVNSLEDTTSESNISVDPGFASGDDRHLGPNAPASVTEGGLDLSDEGFETDMDGVLRSVPWSMGAYEQ